MAITGTIAADFSSFNTAVQNAEVKLRSFESSSGKVESQLSRMTNSFSGVKLIQDATLMAEAVERIGGTSKLTQAELARVGVTANAALEKMKAMGIDVPPALQKIAAETKGLDKVQSNLVGTLKQVAGAFGIAFSVGAVTAAVTKLADFGSRMTDLSARTGIGTSALQEFKFAGEQVGVSLDATVGAVGQLQNRIASGDKSALGALKALGIEFKSFRSLQPEEQFIAIAAKMQDVGDQAAFVKIGMDLMGRGFLEVAPLIRADLQRLIDKARELGVVLDQETIKNLDDLDDSLTSLSAIGQAVIADVLAPMIPLLTKIAEGFMGIGHWVKDAQIAFEQFLSVGSGWMNWYIDANVKVLELTNAFGMNDEKIRVLTESSVYYGAIAADLATTQTQLTKAVDDTARAFEPLDTSYDEAAGKAKAAADAAKRWAEILAELDAVGVGWQGTLATINGTIVEAIKYYLEAGVSQATLATAYGLTAAQVKSVASALKEEQVELDKTGKAREVLKDRVNAAVIAEFEAQVKLNKAQGLDAAGAIAMQTSAAETLRIGLIELERTAQAGISTKAQAKVLTDAYTKSLEDEALAIEKEFAALRKVNAELAQVPALKKAASEAFLTGEGVPAVGNSVSASGRLMASDWGGNIGVPMSGVGVLSNNVGRMSTMGSVSITNNLNGMLLTSDPAARQALVDAMNRAVMESIRTGARF